MECKEGMFNLEKCLAKMGSAITDQDQKIAALESTVALLQQRVESESERQTRNLKQTLDLIPKKAR